MILFDKATYDKLYKEVPSYKLITPAVVSERLKIRGSLARRALLERKGKGKERKGDEMDGRGVRIRIIRGGGWKGGEGGEGRKERRGEKKEERKEERKQKYRGN